MANTQPESYSRGGAGVIITWDAGADILDPSDYSAITQAVLGNAASGFLASDFYLCLKARHLVYSHSPANEPTFHNGETVSSGDCLSGQVDLSSMSTQLAALKGVTTGLGEAASLDPEPISKAIIGGVDQVVSFIGGIFGAHHAAAIRAEQTDICAAAIRTNVLLDQVDSDYYSGKISAADAGTALANIRVAYEQVVQPVQHGTQPSTVKSQCNAACAILSYLDGIIYMRNHYLYPRQAPNPVTSTINNAASSINKAVAANPGVSIILGIVILIILLLATGRKVVVTK